MDSLVKIIHVVNQMLINYLRAPKYSRDSEKDQSNDSQNTLTLCTAKGAK